MAVVVVVVVRQQLVLMLLERQVETVAQAKTSLRFLVKQVARLSKAVVVVVAHKVVRVAQVARVVALTATHLPMRRQTQPQAAAVAM
jgi:ABC-type thiamine transport system ATPase subunit